MIAPGPAIDGNGDREDGDVAAGLRRAGLGFGGTEQHLEPEEEEDDAARELEESRWMPIASSTICPMTTATIRMIAA